MDVNVAKPEVRNDDVLAYQTGDPADWPPELDAVIAAPHEHSVLFENDRVRVLEVNIAPGTTEPVDHHRWPSVLYLTSGSEFIDRAGSGEVLNDSRMRDVPLYFHSRCGKSQRRLTTWRISAARSLFIYSDSN